MLAKENDHSVTFTKVPVDGFTWSTFSDCKKPDSSTQLEVVISEFSGKSVPVALAKFEAANGMDNESFSLPIFLRFVIPFCSIEESILTPNKRLLCGSVAPWYAESTPSQETEAN